MRPDRSLTGSDKAAEPSPYRYYGAAFAGTRPTLRLGDPGIDAHWIRRRRWGAIVAACWGTFLLPLIGIALMSHWGVFGRIDSWQLATFGSENIIFLVILCMPLMFLPKIVTAVFPIDQSTPFLLGMRQAFDDKWGPKVLGKPPAPARFYKARRVLMTIAGVGIAMMIFGIGREVHNANATRPPLPEIPLARLANLPAPLPAAARVTDAIPDLSARWNYDYRIRYDNHHDVYYPLRSPGSPATLSATVVEVDQTDPDDDVSRWNMVNAPGPREGALSDLDLWKRAEMQRAGVKLAPHVILLTRQQLHGTMPSPEETLDVMMGLFGFVTFFMGGVMAWSFGRAARLAAARTSGDFTKV